MSMRHTMKARRALTAAAITTGLAFTVAGCGGDSGGQQPAQSSNSSTPAPAKQPDQKPKENQPETPASDTVLAEVKGGQNHSLTINSVIRDAGGFVTVTGKVRNGRPGVWVPNDWSGDEKELNTNGASMAGASLVDKTGKKKYLVLRDTDGRCLCTKFTGGFKRDEEKTFFAQFPAPPTTSNKVDFQIADMPPASIEITEGQ
ncbi:hypothetical protein GCM10010329_03120 [Streptomyces spiroverticillatus]|uniref:Lipoprotein n=1 Tax=Streptomyces finlayi TaxID=67296 RepID=A0A918WSE4_9ACTN|nr:hypothetical protein [Streptomyces finlayi]GGZ86634.1 hypothetical protein GCM10010329_03120 [Streptomyces spiroverticillatus]GHC78138.1 hypothetical protein GCM10010334_03100 [Streptomyces finlayi]